MAQRVKNKKSSSYLIRNGENKVSPTVIVEPHTDFDLQPLVERIMDVHADSKFYQSRHSEPSEPSKYNEPCFHSSLRFYNEMKNVRNQQQRRVRSVNDLKDIERKIVEGKAVKKLNIPFEKKIYRDLIPLDVSSTCLNPPRSRSSRFRSDSNVRRDIEPKIEDFCSVRSLPEYNVVLDNNSASISSLQQKDTMIRKYDGLKIHVIMRCW